MCRKGSETRTKLKVAYASAAELRGRSTGRGTEKYIHLFIWQQAVSDFRTYLLDQCSALNHSLQRNP